VTRSAPPPLDAVPPLPPPEPPPAQPWGLWATAGFSLVIAVAFVVAQTVALFGVLMSPLLPDGTRRPEELATNGLVLALATFASTPAAIGLSWLFAALRPGITVKDYLGLRAVSLRTTARWCLVLLVMIVVFDLTTLLLKRDLVPEVMISAYQTAQVLPLMWVALVVGAPLAEEVFFRGFLFKGLLHSRLGSRGTILVTAAVWSSIHLQYDLYGITIIFVTGLLLGYARVRTGSIVPGIAMHALMNLLATVQVDLLVRAGGTPAP